MRKESGLEITDRIAVSVSKNGGSDEAVCEFKEYIANQVLADSIELCDSVEGEVLELDGYTLNVAIKKL